MILKNGKRIDGCTDTLPIGTVQPFLGLTPPKGYLVCQGQLVSKTMYPELYAICGNLFGTATETEFYLPDLRGKTIAGYNESDISMNTIGKLLGQKTHVHTTGNHTLTVDEIPTHKHNFQSIPGSSGGDLGDYTLEYLLEEGDAYPGHPGVATSGDWGSYGTLWITETGGSQAHNHGDTGEASNYQPTIIMNWIVKAVMLIPEYFIVENTLESNDTLNALSAAQGKVLNEKIQGIQERIDYTEEVACSYGKLNNNFNYCFFKDGIVYVNLTYKLETALTGGTQYVFANMPEAIKPKGNVILQCGYSHLTSLMSTHYVRSNGEIVIVPIDDVPVGQEINLSGFYFVQ